MNVQFATEELERLYSTPQAELRGRQRLPQQVIIQYKKLVTLLLALAAPEDLRQFKGLRYEHLKGRRKGQCSLRLNDQYRLIVVPLNEETVRIVIYEISKHYE